LIFYNFNKRKKEKMSLSRNIQNNSYLLFKMAVYITQLLLVESATTYFQANNMTYYTHYKVDSIDDSITVEEGVCGTEEMNHTVSYRYGEIKNWPDSIPNFRVDREFRSSAAIYYRGAGESPHWVEECIKALIQAQVKAREENFWKTPNLITVLGGLIGLFLLLGLYVKLREDCSVSNADFAIDSEIDMEEVEENNTEDNIEINIKNNVENIAEQEDKNTITYDAFNRFFSKSSASSVSSTIISEVIESDSSIEFKK
jgi:hypothetical protein